MRPMLDDLELPQVQQIDTDEQRALVEHKPPGMAGSLFQDLGRSSTGFSLWGVATGPEALEFVEELDGLFRAGEPIPFVADITTATQVDEVLIKDLGVRELAGKPERYEYALNLCEYIPPPEPPEEPPEPEPPEPSLDTATLEVTVIVEGQPGFDYSTVTVTVEGTQEDGTTLNRTLTNRTENVWTEEDMPPGTYTVRAVVTEPEEMSGSASATVRAGQTERVTITLRPGQNIAKAFVIHFWFDKAFIERCLRAVMRRVAEYAQNHPNEKLVIVGHTDESGSDDYNQALSERRARSAYAYLTFGRDPDTSVAEWNQLRRQQSGGVRTINDNWGTRQYENMLQDLGYYSGNVDDQHDDITDEAVQAFQRDNGLTVDGVVGDETWPVLIRAYLSQDSLAVPESQFLPNCEGEILKWLGCGEKRPVESTPRGQCADPAWRQNRRTEFLFVNADALPCQVPEPVTFRSGPLGGSAWCLGPGNPNARCCFITRNPNEQNKWLVQLETQTTTVRGSIRFEDGTPLADAEYVLISPDGEYMDGEVICTRPRKGTPIPARTDANGEFSYSEPRRVGVYILEIRGPYIARLEGQTPEAAKGNIVCKRLDGTSDFNVIVCTLATTFDLQVTGATQVGGSASNDCLALKSATEEVLVTAVFPPGTCAAPRSIIWTGGEEVPGHPLQRRVSRANVGQTTVTATMPSSGVTRAVDIFVVRVTLDVDADRDGVVEEDAAGKDHWEFGAGRRGAVILCNNDNDDKSAGNTEIDDENSVVDGANDVSDLASLIIRQSGPLPASVSLVLSADDQSKIRVFDRRSASANAIVGPAPLPSESAPITSSATADAELGMEGTQYPHTANEEIRLTLLLKEGSTELARDEVVVRVAPWIMPSHLEATEELYIVENSGFNDDFVNGVQAAATAAGVPLRPAVAANYGYDLWIQDTMEVGYSQMPGKTLPVVLQAHRDRGLQPFARSELLDQDYGYTEESTLSPSASPAHNTFDSHGNLEVSPPVKLPVTAGGKEYKFGRIYYGRGRSSTPFNSDVRTFLESQLIQSPFDLDTDWLGVGHVDEMMSFIPSNIGRRFRMLFASTDEALRILSDLRSANPANGNLTLFTGKTIAYLRSLAIAAGRPVNEYEHFHERTIDDILADGALLAGNATCQSRLNAIQTRLQTELGIDPATDIIRIPSLFIQEPGLPGIFSALIPGMVNLLVITRSNFTDTQLVFAKPFGPVLAGVDQLEKNVRDQLNLIGYSTSQIHFVDDFDTYHINLGEVHCGTNSRRRPPTTSWWEQTDF